MRELELVDVSCVEGGGALIPLLVVGGVLGLAAIGVAAYAVYNNCSGSVEVGEDGVKLDFDCKKPDPK